MSSIHSMSGIRIPQILEKKIIEHKSHTQIAEDLDVSTKTIQRDTKEPLYERLRNAFVGTYIRRILEFANSEKDQLALEGNKEIGRMLRTGITRRSSHKEDLTATHNIIITENRKKKDELYKALDFTPEQKRILEATFTTLPTEKEGT